MFNDIKRYILYVYEFEVRNLCFGCYFVISLDVPFLFFVVVVQVSDESVKGYKNALRQNCEFFCASMKKGSQILIFLLFFLFHFILFCCFCYTINFVLCFCLWYMYMISEITYQKLGYGSKRQVKVRLNLGLNNLYTWKSQKKWKACISSGVNLLFIVKSKKVQTLYADAIECMSHKSMIMDRHGCETKKSQ